MSVVLLRSLYLDTQLCTEILAVFGFKSESLDESGGQSSLIRVSYLELAHTKFAASSMLPEPLYVAT
jgi:hypothetical protein